MEYPKSDYILLRRDAAGYVSTQRKPQSITTGARYADLSFFSPEDTRRFLLRLRIRFCSVRAISEGPSPDRDRRVNRFRQQKVRPGALDDHTTQIGIGRAQAGFSRLAQFNRSEDGRSPMLDAYFTPSNRYDVFAPQYKYRVQ